MGTTTLEKVYAGIDASGAIGVVVTGDPFFTANHTKLVQFAVTKRLPAVYFNRVFADAGGLISYGGSFEDLYRRSAGYVDRILIGAKPADIPVEQPTKFQLVINLKAAEALGLRIPQSLLLRADHVIE